MVNTAALKRRMKELIEYFTVQYIKAYKTALILHLRDAKNASAAEKPDWQLMLDNKSLIKDPQIEGTVYVGEGFKTAKHWSMAANYVVTEKPIEPADGGADAASPRSGGADGEKKEEAAAATTTDGSASSSSATPAAAAAGDVSHTAVTADGAAADEDDEEGAPKKEARIWQPDDTTECCENPACGVTFTFTKRRTHCRSCGHIFCSKCTSFKCDKEKVCEQCHIARTSAPDPTVLPPLLERPKIKIRLLNFNRYEVELHESEQFANAGASGAAEKAALPGSKDKWLLCLTHSRATRPQMIVAFTSKDERDKWMGLIKSASSFSPSPITLDPILRKTFIQAYNNTRWHCWLWGCWHIDGTEAEMLTDCIYVTLERELFGPELHKLKADFAKNILKKSITGIIHAGVAAGWAAVQAGLAAIRGPIEAKAAELLDPVFALEVEIKNKIKAPLEEGANKALDKAEAKLQEQFASALPVIGAACEAELNLIHNCLCDLLAEAQADKHTMSDIKAFNRKYEWMRWHQGWQYWGMNKPISTMIDNKLRAKDSSHEQRVLAGDLNENLKNLNQSAFVVIRRSLTQCATPQAAIDEIQRLYPDIIARAAHDLRLIMYLDFVKCLDSTLRPSLMESVDKLLKSTLEPVNALIPGPLKDIFDPVRTGHECINDVLVATEKNLVTKMIAALDEETRKQATKIGTQGCATKAV